MLIKNKKNSFVLVVLSFFFTTLLIQHIVPDRVYAQQFYKKKYIEEQLISVFGLGSRISKAGSEILLPYKQNGKLHLGLQDSISIAMERNLDIYLTQEVLAQADADLTMAWAAMLPYIGAEGTYTRLDEDLTFELGPLAVGPLSMGPISMIFMERDIYKAGIVLRQPVFAGGRLKAARRAAKNIRDARIHDQENVKNEIIYQVTRIYHTAQVARAFNKVAIEAVALLEKHERDVKIFVREGAIPQVDLLRTQTELANTRKELNGAENAFDLALSSLKNLMVIDLEEEIFLTEHLSHPPGQKKSLEALTLFAIKNRSELASLKLQAEAAKEGLKAARGEYLPSIAIEGRYEYVEGDVRDLDGDDHWTVGAGAEVPLWNWGKTRSKILKAKSKLNQAKMMHKKTEERISLEVRSAFLNIGKAEKNITAAEAALKTSKEAYRLETARYKAGAGTNTDVLDARTALSKTDANYAQALFEYNTALAALERATGMMGKSSLKKRGD
ncbi:MAG TPA: TolC family protein [Desulfobacteraceae bacterium]|nr:TolC family protein [Desulfobacteraceae bacterium]